MNFRESLASLPRGSRGSRGSRSSAAREVPKEPDPKEATHAPADTVNPTEVRPPNERAKLVPSQSKESNAGKDKAQASQANPEGKPQEGSHSGKYGKPTKLGLKQINYINVHRKDYTGRITLLQGPVEGLGPEDETDLLIVYVKKRGEYKANQDSALAALNRAGCSLPQLEKETKPQPSYRRHYHCWLSRPIPKPRPPGLEYKRLLVYEDPGEELTRDDTIVLDIMKCISTVIGGDVQIQSVLIPLSGALLSPKLRKHFVKAIVEVAYTWLQMGLPVREVKILLPDTDITKDVEAFNKVKVKLTQTSEYQIEQTINYDVFFSYAQGDKDHASEMMEYLRAKNPAMRIFDAEPRDVSVRERGVVNLQGIEAICQSRIFLSLLSDDYFHSVECTEAFSLAYCRDFDSQGNFIIPMFWRSCDLTPLARRLVATEGVDCREASFESATMLLDEIIIGLDALKEAGEEEKTSEEDGFATVEQTEEGRQKMNIADKLLMAKQRNDDNGTSLFDQGDESQMLETLETIPENTTEVSNMFFDEQWRVQWSTDFAGIVFGPRIGAGGFGEVYKCKWNDSMVAVKTLQKIEDDDPQAVMAEFMVEMKLMSKLKHGNIVSFLSASIAAPKLAIILEFMSGGSLYRAIHRRRRNNLGPFPMLKSLWIAYGIAKGMTYLHSQVPVIIHRDLKSPNILLGNNVREVKITDFGLSRLRVRTYVNTGPGGTPEWMAPELLRQDPFEEQSDVYSFGVILWELVMCEKPWKDDHPMQIVFKVGSRGAKLETPPASACIPEVRDLIERCFAEEPTSRPKFAELVKTLDGFCHRSEKHK